MSSQTMEIEGRPSNKFNKEAENKNWMAWVITWLLTGAEHL